MAIQSHIKTVRISDLHVAGFDGWLMPIDDDKYLSLNSIDEDYQSYKNGLI